MEIKQEIIFDSGTADGCFSVRKQNYIEINGLRQDIGQPERRAFYPGEFEALESYAPELVDTFRAIWTPDVIAAWEAKQAAIREQQGAHASRLC